MIRSQSAAADQHRRADCSDRVTFVACCHGGSSVAKMIVAAVCRITRKNRPERLARFLPMKLRRGSAVVVPVVPSFRWSWSIWWNPVLAGSARFPVTLADFVVGRPLWVLVILWLRSTVTAGISARNLRFDFNPDAVFGGDNQVVKCRRTVSTRFRRRRNGDHRRLRGDRRGKRRDAGRAHLASPDGARVREDSPRAARRESDLDGNAARHVQLAAQDDVRADHQRDPSHADTADVPGASGSARRRCRSALW